MLLYSSHVALLITRCSMHQMLLYSLFICKECLQLRRMRRKRSKRLRLIRLAISLISVCETQTDNLFHLKPHKEKDKLTISFISHLTLTLPRKSAQLPIQQLLWRMMKLMGISLFCRCFLIYVGLF